MIDNGFVSGLIADGPAPEYREKLMLYGQFVGDWTAEATEVQPDNTTVQSRWDICFQWVLEGRAIQDLWITPVRDGSVMGWHDRGNRYSTTIRMYDPVIDAWHILWINPPGSYITRQIGKQVGAEIIQLADTDKAGRISRWVYRDITPNSFRWCNEQSSDQGQTWGLRQEIRAKRLGDR